MKVRLIPGDMRRALRLMKALGVQVDSCVTDPPYHLTSIVKRFGKPDSAPAKVGQTGAFARASRGFMGKEWDGGDLAFDPETWALVYDVLKPGGHLIAFGGTRTHHRIWCAIEDAGFEIRDTLSWLYGSGFPKSHNQKDEWEGWGTALKPAFEPICLARKALSEKSVAANVQKHGTGAINVNGCRVGGSECTRRPFGDQAGSRANGYGFGGAGEGGSDAGRWPANVVHDGSDEVIEAFPDAPGQQREVNESFRPKTGTAVYGDYGPRPKVEPRGDSGSAARFFYSAKATAADRFGSKHPTVKPVDLMRWLVRLVTPPKGLVLDPFGGSGSTGVAAWAEGMRCVLIEREPEYQADIRARLEWMAGGGAHSDSRKIREELEPLPLLSWES